MSKHTQDKDMSVNDSGKRPAGPHVSELPNKKSACGEHVDIVEENSFLSDVEEDSFDVNRTRNVKKIHKEMQKVAQSDIGHRVFEKMKSRYEEMRDRENELNSRRQRPGQNLSEKPQSRPILGNTRSVSYSDMVVNRARQPASPKDIMSRTIFVRLPRFEEEGVSVKMIYTSAQIRVALERIGLKPNMMEAFGQGHINNEWCVTLKRMVSPETIAELCLQKITVRLNLPNGTVKENTGFLNLANGNMMKLRVLWAPYFIPHEDIVNELSQFGKVRASDFEEHTQPELRGVRSLTRVYYIEANPADIPSSVNLYWGGKKYTLLLTWPGRGQLCLRCNKEGHVRAVCKERICGKCFEVGHTYDECPELQAFAMQAADQTKDKDFENQSEAHDFSPSDTEDNDWAADPSLESSKKGHQDGEKKDDVNINDEQQTSKSDTENVNTDDEHVDKNVDNDNGNEEHANADIQQESVQNVIANDTTDHESALSKCKKKKRKKKNTKPSENISLDSDISDGEEMAKVVNIDATAKVEGTPQKVRKVLASTEDDSKEAEDSEVKDSVGDANPDGAASPSLIVCEASVPQVVSHKVSPTEPQARGGIG